VQISHGRTDEPVQAGTVYAPHVGQVQLDALLRADGVFINAAVFSPCARTSWHLHESGQVILVTAGKGVVATKDGHVEIVQAGDVVHAPPGEEHWHGAAPDRFMTHTAMLEVDAEGNAATWGEHVADEDYNAAPAA
jgi:quercetin dioxygenase-like cupin family protein